MNSWEPFRSSSHIKAYFSIVLLVIFLTIQLVLDDYKVLAPLLALVSANLLAVRAIPHVGETPKWGTILHRAIGVFSAVSGMQAAWYWLASVEGVSPWWSGLGVVLVLMFAGIIWVGLVYSKTEGHK